MRTTYCGGLSRQVDVGLDRWRGCCNGSWRGSWNKRYRGGRRIACRGPKHSDREQGNTSNRWLFDRRLNRLCWQRRLKRIKWLNRILGLHMLDGRLGLHWLYRCRCRGWGRCCCVDVLSLTEPVSGLKTKKPYEVSEAGREMCEDNRTICNSDGTL